MMDASEAFGTDPASLHDVFRIDDSILEQRISRG
jgi:hypothetical protein